MDGWVEFDGVEYMIAMLNIMLSLTIADSQSERRKLSIPDGAQDIGLRPVPNSESSHGL
jgi:hypothetical protein